MKNINKYISFLWMYSPDFRNKMGSIMYLTYDNWSVNHRISLEASWRIKEYYKRFKENNEYEHSNNGTYTK